MTPAPFQPKEPDVRIDCRFAADGCCYVATGGETFVRSNYRQHLKESHAISCPRVEPEELVPAGSPVEDAHRITFGAPIPQPAPNAA